jgi:hypothetical protein
MGLKKGTKGKVLGKFESFTIRQVPTFEGTGKNKRVKTSTIAIFSGKNKLKDGFKNLNHAQEFITSNNFDRKTKTFSEDN